MKNRNPLSANMYVFFEKIPFFTKVINLEKWHTRETKLKINFNVFSLKLLSILSIFCYQFYFVSLIFISHTHTHTHTRVSTELLSTELVLLFSAYLFVSSV